MASTTTVVVKVGGSLLEWEGLPAALAGHLGGLGTARPLLVAGGGSAADFVRRLDSRHGFGENRAHGLALRALDLSAHALAETAPGLVVAEGPRGLGVVWLAGKIPVLAPRRFLDEFDRASTGPLPERWEVTSDSIAARLATLLGAGELHLLKSRGLDGLVTVRGAADAGLVDPYFPAAAAGLARVVVVNLRRTPPTSEMLAD